MYRASTGDAWTARSARSESPKKTARKYQRMSRSPANAAPSPKPRQTTGVGSPSAAAQYPITPAANKYTAKTGIQICPLTFVTYHSSPSQSLLNSHGTQRAGQTRKHQRPFHGRTHRGRAFG